MCRYLQGTILPDQYTRDRKCKYLDLRKVSWLQSLRNLTTSDCKYAPGRCSVAIGKPTDQKGKYGAWRLPCFFSLERLRCDTPRAPTGPDLYAALKRMFASWCPRIANAWLVLRSPLAQATLIGTAFPLKHGRSGQDGKPIGTRVHPCCLRVA